MDFIENMYVGESIKDIGLIYYSLKRKIPVFNIYCICVNENSNHIMEVIKSSYLFSTYKNKKYIIVGVAEGKKQAISLVANIFKDCVDNNLDILEIKNALINNIL